MDIKIFFQYIDELKDLLKQEKSFKNKIRIKRINRKIIKLINNAAMIQAENVYNQTIELYQNILTSNLS